MLGQQTDRVEFDRNEGAGALGGPQDPQGVLGEAGVEDADGGAGPGVDDEPDHVLLELPLGGGEVAAVGLEEGLVDDGVGLVGHDLDQGEDVRVEELGRRAVGGVEGAQFRHPGGEPAAVGEGAGRSQGLLDGEDGLVGGVVGVVGAGESQEGGEEVGVVGVVGGVLEDVVDVLLEVVVPVVLGVLTGRGVGPADVVDRLLLVDEHVVPLEELGLGVGLGLEGLLLGAEGLLVGVGGLLDLVGHPGEGDPDPEGADPGGHRPGEAGAHLEGREGVGQGQAAGHGGDVGGGVGDLAVLVVVGVPEVGAVLLQGGGHVVVGVVGADTDGEGLAGGVQDVGGGPEGSRGIGEPVGLGQGCRLEVGGLLAGGLGVGQELLAGRSGLAGGVEGLEFVVEVLGVVDGGLVGGGPVGPDGVGAVVVEALAPLDGGGAGGEAVVEGLLGRLGDVGGRGRLPGAGRTTTGEGTGRGRRGRR